MEIGSIRLTIDGIGVVSARYEKRMGYINLVSVRNEKGINILPDLSGIQKMLILSQI
jgi:hypothetical protein